MSNSVAPPIAQFTVTVHATHVEVVDHADQSCHTFATLLGAMSHLEMVCLARKCIARQGGLQ